MKVTIWEDLVHIRSMHFFNRFCDFSNDCYFHLFFGRDAKKYRHLGTCKLNYLKVSYIIDALIFLYSRMLVYYYYFAAFVHSRMNWKMVQKLLVIRELSTIHILFKNLKAHFYFEKFQAFIQKRTYWSEFPSLISWSTIKCHCKSKVKRSFNDDNWQPYFLLGM